MNRIGLMAFLFTALGTASLGANNAFFYVLGKKPISHRDAYCEVAKVRGPLKTWATYREKKMQLEVLPEFIQQHLKNSENEIANRLKQITNSIRLLALQKQKLSRTPASKVTAWKIETEIPSQMKSLEREAATLSERLRHLQHREFSEVELSNIYLEAKQETSQPEALPSLGFELEYSQSWFGDEIQLNTVWVKEISKTNWSTQLASPQPLIRLKKTMLTDGLTKAFESEKLPPWFDSYSRLASTQMPSLDSIRWKYLPGPRLVMLASPSTHIGLQAVLDLGCLQ